MRLSVGVYAALLVACLPVGLSFRKVVVQAVYKEKDWAIDAEVQKQYGFSVFGYQKLDPQAPHYFKHNRGTETGVYLKYIVDHYHDFPDVAVFVHAHPEVHNEKWLQMVGCISPNATYFNLNFGGSPWFDRGPDYWNVPQVIEQCWRDIIQTLWGLRDDKAEFLRRLPPTSPLKLSGVCCNQFILSRGTVHQRPLHVWKQLLRMIAAQPTCHIGELDHEHLYSFNRTGVRAEPEREIYPEYGESAEFKTGALVQGGAGEFLSHVIFGHKALEMQSPTRTEMCQNFLKDCPGSPCGMCSACPA